MDKTSQHIDGISIILPTYNRLYSLKKIILPSLNKQTYKNFELIIIDDCSKDGTEAYFDTLKYKEEFENLKHRIVYVRNEANRGAPYSRNRGVKLAKFTWIYVVEDDVFIENTSFLKLASEIIGEADGDVSVICPQRFDVISGGYYHNPPNSFARIGRFSGEIYIDNSQKYSGVVPTAHASSFVNRDVYLQVLEDENLFFGNTFRDETDLYAGITKLGHKIYYVGDRLQSLHRNDFARNGGQKKVTSNPILRQELMVWHNHYRYLDKHYALPGLRIIAFVLVRFLKILSNLTKIKIIKSTLSKCRI